MAMRAMRDHAGRNLVLGIIDNYNYHDISLFLLSLKKVNYSGHICLFVGPNVSQRTVKSIKEHGVEVILYKKEFPFITDPHPGNFARLPEPIHIYNFRHFLYYNYLLTHQHDFKNVLITDVKDVVFQKDPFDFTIEEKIYVAVENVSVPIFENHYTAMWIRRGYDECVLSMVGQNEVICAGTTLAPLQLMLKFLKRLIEEFFNVKDAYKCADQAMLNVLIHTNQIEVFRCYNFYGPFLTLDTQADYRLNNENDLVNRNGDVINIVHQYDRYPQLLRIFVRQHQASAFWIMEYPKLKSRIKKAKKQYKKFAKYLKLK
jgi:hypothetical protein